MRADWFADLIPSPASPPAIVDPSREPDNDAEARAIVEFRLAESPGLRPVVIGAPGETVGDVISGLRGRYGQRLIEARAYRSQGND